VLRRGEFDRIAVANPATAPYGAAAIEAMKSLSVYDLLAAKIVQGTNIAQTWQFVESGNAEIGFVARSQVTGKPAASVWNVPAGLYSPIRQDAVLLRRGNDNDAARAFMAFLKDSDVRAVVQKFGYADAP
jgi:molybdate transport system substrate-binding protein